MAPLAVGTHTIHFDATISSFVEDTTYLSPDGATTQRQGQRRQLWKALLQSGLGSPCRSQDRDAQMRVLPGLDSHHRPGPDHQSHYRCTDRQHQPELNTNELVLNHGARLPELDGGFYQCPSRSKRNRAYLP